MNTSVGIGFAYIKYNSLDLQKPSRIISALIKQLCSSRREIPPQLLRFYQRATYPNLEEYKANFLLLAESFSQIFIIVDALDEFKQDQRQHIIEFLLQLSQHTLHAKIFVTSRRESDIEREFLRCQTSVIQIEARNVSKDIDFYVRNHVRDLINDDRLKIVSSRLKDEVMRILIERAEGM